ncbi:hypothetical protein [Streptomyces collinus]|uniref:Uncharacterized protein n=1 Tax=Streptomyces collinus (strain DSM 40733 / Tue 365) TaxID=1214242 RepID=S5V1J5_STRC3|nr:hypothetical protein [Streptomyces collinus]AGS71826.1 hypothetical protein B446_25075 [Streptomyces collinus Tu 365]UJA10477.1 hypothetical protein HGI10_44410 [Streptomyces collinus]UJA14659.1 hypothetical protein HGI09_19710 [Streptomyces collinus]
MSDTSTLEFEPADNEIHVIPVTDFRNTDGDFEHRLAPLSATTRAEEYLQKHDDVHLSDEGIRRLVQGAVEPQQFEGIRVERHRVETGWLMVISYRAYSPMVSLAIENDRLLAEASYAADPRATGVRKALAMPEPHIKHAVLVHADDYEDILESVDRSAQRVLADNRQEVGERLVERPLMLVPATFKSGTGEPDEDLTAVDGNCRLAFCYHRIPVPRGWVDDSLIGAASKELVELRPSHLMRMSLQHRRELVRKVIKAAHKRLKEPRTGSPADIRSRNKAAMTLNALTIPVTVIVGYRDDNDQRGMQRFPAGVRSLLLRMNTGGKVFVEGAKNAVKAEEIINGLYDEGLLGPEAQARPTRDALIGRGEVAASMEGLGFNPGLPDLRFALIMQQLTLKSPKFNALVRSKLQTEGNLVLSRRNGPIVELGLRSYSVSMPTNSPRTALETICLWQDLVDNSWSVENIDTDTKVDKLLARANTGETQAALLLGALGMISLVMSGHLLAAAGSAEADAGTTIARTGVGLIVKGLLAEEEGRQILADAIKRVRAGKAPRWWDAEKQGLVEQPSDWRGSTYNAMLRSAVRHGWKAKGPGKEKTAAEQEADKLTVFQEQLGTAVDRLRDLLDLREKNGTKDRLAWVEVEASFARIEDIAEDLRLISEPKPRNR